MTYKEEGESCKVDSDCADNSVCKMFYYDEEKTEPHGRFCAGESGLLRKSYGCSLDSDCPRGKCEVIKNENGHVVNRECRDDNGKVYEDEEKYKDYKSKGSKYRFFSLHPDIVEAKLKKEEAGPVAKLIVFFFSIIGTIFDLILSILFSMFMAVFNMIAGWFLKRKGDLIFSEITDKNKKGGLCFSMWIFRTILTILVPPYGVFMARGLKNGGFVRIMLCCILTGLFYVPGLLYALIITNSSSIAEEEKKYVQCLREKKSINHQPLEGNDASKDLDALQNPFEVHSTLFDS